MSTIRQARTAIQNRFITEWGVTSPFTLDNRGNLINGDLPDTWVRLTVRNMPSKRHVMGTFNGQKKYERRGLILINIFTLHNGGTAEGDDLCQKVKTIFESVRFNDIVTFEADYRDIGARDGKFYQMNVEIEFLYHETR